jgi:hypothetical protein
MSVLEKWIWNPLTPASVPAGARISAGKSGSVLMSLPTSAEVSVNCVPASCMPSPESPAKRIVTEGTACTGLCRPFAPCGDAPPCGVPGGAWGACAAEALGWFEAAGGAFVWVVPVVRLMTVFDCESGPSF